MSIITGQSSISGIEIVKGTANLTDTSSTALLAADSARFTYITDIIITIKAGTTAVVGVTILEVAAAMAKFYVTTTSGSLAINLTTPIKTSAVNKAINAQADSSPTGFDAEITLVGFQAKN
jgi:hypothetical protein|tara:strand:+ start:1559 stop:1921 length:363 start_codon:yes stop_codon:yes gene_type:complete